MSHTEKEVESVPFVVRKAAIVAACCMALSACGNSNIGKVKDMKLDVDPSFTVGQAFDNREVCDSVKWNTVKDERGRTIVEYRCNFKGVKDLVHQRIANEVDTSNKTAQAQKDVYLMDMHNVQTQLEEMKKKLAADQSAPGANDPGSIDKNLRDQIQLLTDQAAVLNTGDVSKIAAITLDPKFGFKDMTAAIECYNAAESGSVAQSQCADNIKQAIPATLYWMNTSINQLQVAVQKDVMQTQGTNNFEISTLQQQIRAFQKRLDEMAAGKDASFASADADLKHKLANMEPANPLEKVDEVFQWSVSDDGEIALVYAGTETRHKDGTVNHLPYRHPDVATQLIAQNGATTFANYNNRAAY